jgi:hypothetical protein
MRKIEKNTIYDYYYDSSRNLTLIRVYEKKWIFKKFFGEYVFIYEANRLIRQISKVATLETTESINYQYDEKGRLAKKEYFNHNGQLRYEVFFSYLGQDILPKDLRVLRMGQFEFFKSENPIILKKMIEIVGADFEGSFFLLALIDEAKNG